MSRRTVPPASRWPRAHSNSFRVFQPPGRERIAPRTVFRGCSPTISAHIPQCALGTTAPRPEYGPRGMIAIAVGRRRTGPTVLEGDDGDEPRGRESPASRFGLVQDQDSAHVFAVMREEALRHPGARAGSSCLVSERVSPASITPDRLSGRERGCAGHRSRNLRGKLPRFKPGETSARQR